MIPAKFKILYQFTVTKEEKVKEPVQEKLESGETVEVIREVTREVPFVFCLQKPNRPLHNRAELFHQVVFNESVQAGVMPFVLLAKRVDNDGGELNEEEKKRLGEVLDDLVKKVKELREIKENEERVNELNAEITLIERQIRVMDSKRTALFNNSADARANTKTILWWLLHLLHEKQGDNNWKPFFGGDTFEQKEEAYDEYEDEDSHPPEQIEFYNKVVGKAAQAISVWFYGQGKNQHDIEKRIEEIEKGN